MGLSAVPQMNDKTALRPKSAIVRVPVWAEPGSGFHGYIEAIDGGFAHLIPCRAQHDKRLTLPENVSLFASETFCFPSVPCLSAQFRHKFVTH